ncbi:hypothetical protein AAF712_015540 [Marasmius tenuissimus]|uniref:ATP synthase F0 subunit 8 n=1 Tax=Marasmius tenuissimus TaxID=585030 RepID=A0ABR2Z9B2_9AGAR
MVVVHFAAFGVALAIWIVIYSLVFWRWVWAYLVAIWQLKVQTRGQHESHHLCEGLKSVLQKKARKEDLPAVVPPSEELNVLSQTTYVPTLLSSSQQKAKTESETEPERVLQAGNSSLGITLCLPTLLTALTAQQETTEAGEATTDQRQVEKSLSDTPVVPPLRPNEAETWQEKPAAHQAVATFIVTATPSSLPSIVAGRRAFVTPNSCEGPELPLPPTIKQHNEDIAEPALSVSGPRVTERVKLRETQTGSGDGGHPVIP